MKKQFRNFQDAQKFVRKLKLKNRNEWLDYCNTKSKPNDVPKYPDAVYKNKGWKGWSDWVGSDFIPPQKRIYLPFEEARNFVRPPKLENRKQWDDYYKSGKKPENIPASPWRVYKNKGWIGLWDWLGTEKPKNLKREYLSFEEAREIIHGFKLQNKEHWSQFLKSGKRPNNIPSTPERIYKNKGWKGWGNWLGTKRIANQNRRYWSFEKSRSYIQKLNLKRRDEFANLAQEHKIPNEIPNTPDHIYKKTGKWVSWGDFLGTGRIHPVEKSKNRSSFIEARNEARKLAKKYNLKNWDDWIKAHKEGKIPNILPQRPDKIYSKKKSKN